MAQLATISLASLKKNFKAFSVPSDKDFSQLIDVAALPLKSGGGLVGGIPSGQENIIETGEIKSLAVKLNTNSLIELGAASGIDIRIVNNGGLGLDENGQLSIKTTKDNSINFTKGCSLKTAGALKVDGDISLELDDKSGLSCSDGKLSLRVDVITITIAKNALLVKCKMNGGLTVAEGYLDIDIKMILGVL